MALVALLDEAGALAAERDVPPARVAALLERLFAAASAAPEIAAALAGAPAGEVLVRLTDAGVVFHLKAGAGALSAAPTDIRRGIPKVDATSATWLGLVGGTLKPWLAFTRGLVVCRAGLTELRWLQQIAERLQRGYADARANPANLEP